MKDEELHILLDEIQFICAKLEVNPDLIHSKLRAYKCLSNDEVHSIMSEVFPTQKIVSLFTFMKAKPDTVFIFLQEIFHIHGYVDCLTVIQTKLKDMERYDLIWQPSNDSTVNSQLKHQIEAVRANLKKHYQQDLRVRENYWIKFGIQDISKMDVFYNQNIIIDDKYRQLSLTIKSPDDLFLTDYKQFKIIADAGYGKSTFVHEMAYQWVEGKKAWTKNFTFLFLFRLSELSRCETTSLQCLLKKCLSKKDSMQVTKWLEDSDYMEKCLFIFDGFDEIVELQEQFCQDIKDMIFGRGAKLASVVVTSRPFKLFEDFETGHLHIELKGYTVKGIEQQLLKFSIDPETICNDLRPILKVPLFHTLFCITHQNATVGYLNLCIVIKKFVQFTCDRHQKLHPNFTESQQTDLLLMLGQAAQNKFMFIKGVNITNVYPVFTQQTLTTAINAGLVYEKSTIEDLLFAHRTIAQYCAAYFWIKGMDLRIKHVENEKKNEDDLYRNTCSVIHFVEPQVGSLQSTESFSAFLCHFSEEYKLVLWRTFERVVPVLDDYKNLPKRIMNENQLNLKCLLDDDEYLVMDKIEFSANEINKSHPIKLFRVSFLTEKKFVKISMFKNLHLKQCFFDISPEDFLHSNCLQTLVLDSCIFGYGNPVEQAMFKSWKNCTVLERLEIHTGTGSMQWRNFNYIFNENSPKSYYLLVYPECWCNCSNPKK